MLSVQQWLRRHLMQKQYICMAAVYFYYVSYVTPSLSQVGLRLHLVFTVIANLLFTAMTLQSPDTCAALSESLWKTQLPNTSRSTVLHWRQAWKEQGEKVSWQIKSIVLFLWRYYIKIKLQSNFLNPPRSQYQEFLFLDFFSCDPEKKKTSLMILFCSAATNQY